MHCTLKQENNKSFIMLEGELTLPYAEELKKTFVQAFANADCVSLTLADIQEVDLSVLQLFCSAHQGAMRSGKQLNIEGNLPQALRNSMGASGYSRRTGCPSACGTNCLWTTAASQPCG
jgi:ABC-type transporter Mla MlaB component